MLHKQQSFVDPSNPDRCDASTLHQLTVTNTQLFNLLRGSQPEGNSLKWEFQFQSVVSQTGRFKLMAY